MRKILIISPHYPPSNLAAVHRSRLFAKHLPAFGWEPVILAVDEAYYEEKLDANLVQLLPDAQKIVKVRAFRVTKPRLIGDIGLRGFFQLRKRALQLVKSEKIDFVYIPIPSFYASLIGPYLRRKTGVKYGIDYIDPWVHEFPGSEVKFSRHWWSTQIARFLEPKAVLRASLITGVASGYYKGVLERHPNLARTCVFGAMPYGGEPEDHEAVARLNLRPYLFEENRQKFQLVYAGAMLPRAFVVLEKLFAAIEKDISYFADVEFHFIGTGSVASDPGSFTIRPVAERYGLWQKVVFEYPARIPYLDVLVHLSAARGIFILGSIEPHYTPSKVFQAVLSKKPILGVLHKDSAAVLTIAETGSGLCLPVDPGKLENVESVFPVIFRKFREFSELFDAGQVRFDRFDAYTAYRVTEKLALLLDELQIRPDL